MPGFPTGGVGTHYGDASLKEDVSDIIYQITPEDTPFYNMSGDGAAQNTLHQWMQRSLNTRQHNAAPEGFTYNFTLGMTLPTRRSNICQIFQKEIRVSETEQATSHYGIDKLFSDQMGIRLVEIKTDIEHALIRGTTASGSITAIRQMSGILEACLNATGAYTNMGGAELTETMLNALTQQGWEQGAEFKDLLVGGRAKRMVSAFTANNTRFIQADQNRLVRSVSVYEGDFFPITVHLSRDLFSNTATTGAFGNGGYTASAYGASLLFIDRTALSKDWLRPVTAQRTAAIADSADGVIKGELTLNFGNPNMHLWATNVSVA